MLTIAAITLFASAAAAPTSCTYAEWTWDSRERRAIDARVVEKPYSALGRDERDRATGCSVCREDQIEISLPGVEPFEICKAVADDVRAALSRAMEAGFEIETVSGYRVGRSKGALDAHGRRTEYSNHSFGLAIDINADRNGLYDRCTEFLPTCRLIRGGEWRPYAPGGIAPETPLYKEMISMGWKWGGELSGRQKDFMHFSPTGD